MNKKRKWKLRIALVSLICLTVLGILFSHEEQMEASCSKHICSVCHGRGWSYICSGCGVTNFGTSSMSGCGNCAGVRAGTKTNCGTCGGNGTQAHYWGTTRTITAATCTTQGTYRYYCSYCGLEGATLYYTTALGHSEPSDYIYADNNGVTNGLRYKNCTRCSTRLDTEYALYIYAGTGIKAVSGTGWYKAGNTAQVTCTPASGYHFRQWSDGDTRQNWSTTMDKAKSFTAYGESYGMTMWANMPTIYTTDSKGYYQITDIATYGANLTSDFELGTHYDDIYYFIANRIAYQKKFSISYGTEINLAGSLPDEGSGGLNTSSQGRIYWNVMEWDSSGNFLWDSGWMYCTQTYDVGTETSGYGNTTGARSDVSYITILFRYSDGGIQMGAESANITPEEVADIFTNLYLCYKPFTYTVNSGPYSVSSTVSRLGTESIFLTMPSLPERTGYTAGWTITSSSTLKPNWMNGKQYSATQINTWLSDSNFYNSLFGNVVFTAGYMPNTYKVTFAPTGGTFIDSSGVDVVSIETTTDLQNNSDISAYTITRKGYTFMGWYTEVSGGTKVYGADLCAANDGVYFSDNKWKYPGDVTLYGRWEKNSYVVTYNSNGGDTPTITKTLHYDDVVDLSPIASKNGYYFIGWSDEPDSRMPISSLTMPDLATSEKADHSDWELTLYAVYSIPVSDVANHTYPEYDKVKDKDVFLRIWEKGKADIFMDYPLTYENDSNIMVYRYSLDITDVTEFVGGMATYCYKLFAYDNAGNWSSIAEGIIDPSTGKEDEDEEPDDIDPGIEEYLQTVNHYQYDIILGEWIKFDTVTELVMKGKTFTPNYITSPTGYKTASIDSAYVVAQAQTSSAYYMPIVHVLTFDANGGNCSVTEKNISYGDYYGEMTTPTRNGYTFTGWYTAKNGGTQVLASQRYLLTEDSTIYAHWKKNSHTVTYDYWTNGGTGVSVTSKAYDYGTVVDLSVIAEKRSNDLSGWKFVGWNTDPNATSKLSSLTISDKDIVLYAIYKKDIVVTITEKNAGETIERTLLQTIYNNESKADFTISETNTWPTWILLGWTTEKDATAAPVVGINGNYTTSDSVTLYALYISEITISYDTNGSFMVIDEQTKECFYNASGSSSYPTFVLAKAPQLSDHSFVEWQTADGIGYQAGSSVVFKTDTFLTAFWDKYPEIEAYDRYFTLEQSKNGEITQAELLRKVKGFDLEDGTLVNGIDVIVKDYNSSIFTAMTVDEEVEITYQATDSFGNVVVKAITVHVADTTVSKSPKVRYVRFVSSRFYADEGGNFLAPERGGLENTSVWRNTESYKYVLESALYNKKMNEKYKNIEYFGTSTEVKIAGSGEWQTEKSTWVFTKEDIEKVKDFVDTHGYGNIREPNALELFIDAFRKCLKLN